jgi:hypothetical protein
MTWGWLRTCIALSFLVSGLSSSKEKEDEEFLIGVFNQKSSNYSSGNIPNVSENCSSSNICQNLLSVSGICGNFCYLPNLP